MRRLKSVLFAAALTLASAQALSFDRLVVLGDSYADSGNNAFVFDTFFGGPRTPTPIPSPGFIPDFPYASDRYSNGPVWVEYFAESLGLDAQASLTGGTNFAFAGARSGPLGSSFPFSLRDQANFYLGAGPVQADTLHAVYGGGNDARDAFASLAGGGDPTALIGAYASNMASIVTQLDGAGARDILLANIPNLGLAPAIRALGPNAQAGASFISMSMNSALDAALAGLTLNSDTNIYRLDMFGFSNRVNANPGAFGLTDVTTACAFSPTCIANPSGIFFWDGIHPTTAGHALIAQEVLAAVPEPETYAMMIAGLSLLGFVARRRNKLAANGLRQI